MPTDANEILADVLGCKWTLGILGELHRGPRRPSELKRSLPGLRDKVLAERLRKLERFGLVRRLDHGEVPPRVTYELSRRGRQLSPVLALLEAWSARWARSSEALAAPPRDRAAERRRLAGGDLVPRPRQAARRTGSRSRPDEALAEKPPA